MALSATKLPPSALLGSRKPRVCNYPPYTDTYGPQAGLLARSAGLVLDPWQQDLLDVILSVRTDGLWNCFECAEIIPRQNGKGAVLEARVLAGLFLLDERLIMWSAHEHKTALEAFRRVHALIEATPDLKRQVRKVAHSHGEEGIELRTGARLRFLARSKGSGRGFSGDLNIIDEAYAYTEEQQAALMPTLSARPNAQIIYASSPPLDSDTGEPLFALRARGEAGNDPGLGWFDWGAALDPDKPGDKLRLDDPELWAATNPALGIRISVETVERERRAMTAQGFARERLGVWPKRSGATSVIDLATWATLADEDSQHGPDVVFAVDITPARDYASIAVYGVREDGRGHAELVEHRPGTDWIVERLAVLKERWNPIAIGLDTKGPAVSLLLDLEKAGIRPPDNPEKPQRADLAVPTAQEVAAACGQFADAVTQGTLRHIDQAPLNAAVAGAKTRPLGDSWGWARRAASVDISPLCAVTNARWAYESRAHLVNEPAYDPLANIF